MKLNVKYFSASDFDSAKKDALSYFSCEENELIIETMTQGNEDIPYLVMAISCKTLEESAAAINMDGSFKLYYEREGVFLELYKNRGSGVAQSKEIFDLIVSRKSLRSFLSAEADALFAKGWGRVLVASAQEEKFLAEEAVISVSKDEMEGRLELLPPEEGQPLLTKDDILLKIKSFGITFGIDDRIIDEILERRNYNTQYIVAKGANPINGEDGRIELHFRTEHTGAPKVDSNDRADFRALDLFVPVKENELLATIIPATPGAPGSTVKGREIPQKPGKEAKIPKTKNTFLSEDKKSIYAQMSGLVEYINGQINVYNVYTVKGDCNMGVGNIDFDGNVVIQGNVLANMKVKASGSITIGGVAEGSEFIAGGNIEIRNGMQGMDKGRVIAGGSVTAKYIERATVIAGDTVYADMLLHSQIEAAIAVRLKGKYGSITGGVIRAGKEVTAVNLGSYSYATTDIEVGIVPQKRNRYEYLIKEINRINEENIKLEQIEKYLAKTGPSLDPAQREKLELQVAGSKQKNAQLLEEFSEEHYMLELEVNNTIDGKVHVFETANPGVKITIGSSSYKVNEPITFATFKFRDGEITFGSCEASR